MSTGTAPAPTVPVRRGPLRGHSDARLRSERRFGYLLVAPLVALLLLVTAYPLVYNLWNSFHKVNLSIAGQGHPFVGVDNYSQMFGSSEWVSSLERTLAFTGVSVFLETIAALGLALMLHRRFPGRGILRAAVLVPWAVPTVVSAMLWKTMFDPRSGFVDYLLGKLGLPGGHTTWLAGVWTSWATILVADAWKNVPFMAIILLAGLQVIPGEVYDAARMDGANWLQTFRRITLPLLKPALGVALIFRTLQAFLVFDVIYIMTGGGPGVSTETLSFINWQAFLVSTDFGYGGAISVMLVVIALAIAFVYVRIMRLGQQAA
ncbi:MAG TPA: sugar ABC transporter permease [Solirubrobacteraceae bacterium]|nr:sugar ABC transporter permease [Solirubrobacteraceae bacterium]